MTKKQFMICQYNQGKLTLADAQKWINKGYAFICHNGKLIDIIREEIYK